MLLVIFYCIAVQLCFVVLFVVRAEELNGWISKMSAWAGSLGGGAVRVCWVFVWAVVQCPVFVFVSGGQEADGGAGQDRWAGGG